MYVPHEHAQHPYHRVLSVACPGFLTVPQGGMPAPPEASAISRQLSAISPSSPTYTYDIPPTRSSPAYQIPSFPTYDRSRQ